MGMMAQKNHNKDYKGGCEYLFLGKSVLTKTLGNPSILAIFNQKMAMTKVFGRKVFDRNRFRMVENVF